MKQKNNADVVRFLDHMRHGEAQKAKDALKAVIDSKVEEKRRKMLEQAGEAPPPPPPPDKEASKDAGAPPPPPPPPPDGEAAGAEAASADVEGAGAPPTPAEGEAPVDVDAENVSGAETADAGSEGNPYKEYLGGVKKLVSSMEDVLGRDLEVSSPSIVMDNMSNFVRIAKNNLDALMTKVSLDVGSKAKAEAGTPEKKQ